MRSLAEYQKVYYLYEQHLATIPSWSNFLIRDSGKYLGFMIGPGALSCELDSVGSKMFEITDLVKGLGLPQMQSIILYNVLALSKALFFPKVF